ncbi:hypothetical protein like AT5G44450 [Hibiscus trionum]|uniref:Alpha N-terminal protein methyltransferase 1 n=1 Tax=Hibiscus trionum TaxID=183268 RepID=A0A9W7HHB2_HIBTR|nr:hypothetical protein like AT5G44450 [Hibiscus trionum]
MWIRPIPKAVPQQYPIVALSPPPYLGNRVKTATTKASSSAMEAAGTDSDGREFKSAQEMWREQAGDDPKKSQWYREGVAYWEGVEASVDGVLGGFGQVNDADINGSEAFLNTLLHERFGDAGRNQHLVALDCGSGIGRVTKNLLIRYFNEVDLLEPVSHFLDAARESLSQEHFVASDVHKATNFYCVPLQEFTPGAGRYNVIWIQWCIGHLTDDDFLSFFKRAKVGLKPGGFFILKENIARNGFVLDKEDRSITRSDLYFKDLFRQCGLHLYKMKEQKGLPEELFAVKMYALTTEATKKTRSKGQAIVK